MLDSTTVKETTVGESRILVLDSTEKCFLFWTKLKFP
jgi:hypothetical protein